MVSLAYIYEASLKGMTLTSPCYRTNLFCEVLACSKEVRLKGTGGYVQDALDERIINKKINLSLNK